VVTILCGNEQIDISCLDKVRKEIIDGIHRTKKINLDPSDSICNRLVKALIYLKAQFPLENWSQYLNGNSMRWEKIITASHPQGGGHATPLARLNL